jgi:hypothetical protein
MKTFRIYDKNGEDCLGLLTEDNCMVTAYGKLKKGVKPAELEVGEACVKEYSLAGQKPTEYRVVRVS